MTHGTRNVFFPVFVGVDIGRIGRWLGEEDGAEGGGYSVHYG